MDSITVVIISIISILIIISSITNILAQKTKIPFTILLVIIGFFISLLTKPYQYEFQQLLHYQGYSDILLYICLPTLVFEAAFTMDGRLLRQNIVPILTLAIPGLFISTALIGIIVSMLTPLPLLTALLLGAILSATDSVAVIAIFRQMGVPKRLAVLIEGESLFNSSTGFVVLKTILFIMLAKAFTTSELVSLGISQFCWNFFCGIAAGAVTAIVIRYLMSWVDNMPLISASLAIVMAYLSFIIAEQVFHASGIMATITAGVLMAYWGKTKLTAEVEQHVHHLLAFLIFIVNSLIFILVGFAINISVLLHSLSISAIVILAVLIARAVMVFGLLPILSKLPHFVTINWRYQVITWLGGIQGAIGLTMVLGLSNLIPQHELLISIVMSVVIFTIIAQGSLMIKLIHWLQLDKVILSDKYAKIEAELEAENKMLKSIPKLQSGGLFSYRIAREFKKKCKMAIKVYKKRLRHLTQQQLTPEKEEKLIFLSSLGAEKHVYHDLFRKGHISELTYRHLIYIVDMEIDLIRFQGRLTKALSRPLMMTLFMRIMKALQAVPLLSGVANQLIIDYSIMDYELKWAAHQGCAAVLEHLNDIKKIRGLKAGAIEDVIATFTEWYKVTRTYLHEFADQFPEFVHDMQNRFAKRIFLHAKYDAITRQIRQGLLPQPVGDKIIEKYMTQIRRLGRQHPEKLRLNVFDLLRHIPFFKTVSDEELGLMMPLLQERRVPPGEVIIQQGGSDDNLYLISRGVVSIIKEKKNHPQEVAVLMAGDFFGELALLYHIKRTATCKAVTPCVLYMLTADHFKKLIAQFPDIQEMVLKEGRERRKKSHLK